MLSIIDIRYLRCDTQYFNRKKMTKSKLFLCIYLYLPHGIGHDWNIQGYIL